MKPLRVVATAIRHLPILLALALALVPFAWILASSLKSLPEFYRFPPTFLPETPTLDNFDFALNTLPLVRTFYENSVVVTVASVALTVIVSTFAGFAFARLKFPFRDALFWLMVVSIYFPTYVVSTFALYELTRVMGLLDSRLGLILPYTALGLPIYVFVMRTAFQQIPRELQDAASIDGASAWVTFRQVMLPLVTPGMIVVTMLAFTGIWGEYLIARTIAVGDAMTIGVGLTNIQSNMGDTEFPIVSAVFMAAIVPPVLLFIALQRWFIRGLSDGIIKL